MQLFARTRSEKSADNTCRKVILVILTKMHDREQFAQAHIYPKLLPSFSDSCCLNGFVSFDTPSRKKVVGTSLVDALNECDFITLDDNNSTTKSFHGFKVTEEQLVLQALFLICQRTGGKVALPR